MVWHGPHETDRRIYCMGDGLMVVNQFIPGIFGWLAPTVLGTAFIVYQSRKLG
jgi:hypothetical protein